MYYTIKFVFFLNSRFMLNVHEPVLVSLCACNSVFASSNFTVIKSPKGIFLNHLTYYYLAV